MQEIASGLWDWATFHEGIGQEVHSHLVAASGTLIDPRLPDDGGVEAVAAVARPQRIVLTNRHHLRHASAFVEAFGCSVWCHEAGVHEFAPAAKPAVKAFAFGDVLAADVRAVEIGALTPEETALALKAEDGGTWLALADVLTRPGGDGALEYFPDALLGDDPDAVRGAMTAALRRVLENETFTGLLLAHGEPLPDGRRALEAFVASQA